MSTYIYISLSPNANRFQNIPHLGGDPATPLCLKCVANNRKNHHSECVLLGVLNYDDHCTVVIVIHGRLIYPYE